MRSDSMQVRNAGTATLTCATTWSSARGQTLRRFLIVLAMLVEAGLPFFPRVPLTGVLFAVSGLAVIMNGGLDRRSLPLFAVPIIVMIEMALFQAGTSPEQIVSRFVNFCSAIFLANLYLRMARNQIADDMRPILRFMAVQGSVTVLLANIVPDFFATEVFGDTVYKTIGFVFTYHMTLIDTFAKADGFFFERGVFQIFLNIYLYFSLFQYKSKLDGIFAILGILSTWSTAGAVIMVLIFASFVMFDPRRSLKKSRLRSLIVMAVIVIPLAILAYFNVQDKIFGSQASSASARQFDFTAGIQIVKENPVTGIGFSSEVFTNAFRAKANLAQAGELLVERGMSNGILRLFITIGIPLGLVFLFGLFNSRFFSNPILVGLTLFLSLLSEPIIFCPFILLVIFSGLIFERQQAVARQSRLHGI